jgi:membrane protein DedA with SNARE-associated domain
MSAQLQFLAENGYAVLFCWVLAEQAGLPIPALPMLLAAGALAATGQMSLLPAVLLAILAAMLADTMWYQFGKRRGVNVLSFLCRISLEPDSCVRQTQAAFANRGVQALLIAKFVPGLNTASTPMAGITRVPLAKFLLFDAAGSALWAGGFILIGYIFSAQIEMVTNMVVSWAGSFFTMVIVGLALYIMWKFIKRQLFLRELRVLRLEASELKALLDGGAQVVVVDLRHPADYANEPRSIIGAIRMSPQEIEEKHDQIPRGTDVILYCT